MHFVSKYTLQYSYSVLYKWTNSIMILSEKGTLVWLKRGAAAKKGAG